MQSVYEVIRLPPVRVKRATRAVLEPRLISERRMTVARETRTEFRGMFQPGWTCQDVNSAAIH